MSKSIHTSVTHNKEILGTIDVFINIHKLFSYNRLQKINQDDTQPDQQMGEHFTLI